MSPFRKALAAAAMAVAAAGGGLLVTGAGAMPASAATQVPSLGGHSGAHVVATVTFQRAAPAASSTASGPGVILPCAVHSPGPAATAGAASYGGDDTCDSGIITCDVITHEPTLLYSNGDTIDFFADTWCSDEVDQIRMGQDVIHSTPIDPNNPLTDSVVKNDTNHASTSNSAACRPGQYAVNASARIVPPDGYIVTGSLHDTSATVTFTASDCGSGGGGGGGGGGCATAAPPVSAQPSTRRPDLIVCQ
jgi:hypothetical protein